MNIERMPRFLLDTLLVSGFVLATTGCGLATAGFGTGGEEKETVYALDGVKLISSSITWGTDPKTMEQKSYEISNSSRLLLRFESLSTASIRIQSTKPVKIRIFAVNESERTKAMSSLRICPITKNWMMAATWDSAYPGRDGGWTPGGEIELDDCVSASAPESADAPTPAASTGRAASSNPVDLAASPCSDPGAICFDVGSWYNNYVIQRSQNFGLALISFDGVTVQVYGDGSGSKGPRIHWTESTTSSSL